jgi:undecaprenyl-diphosphatase
MDPAKNTFAYIFHRKRLGMLILAFLLFWIPVITFSKLAGEIVENEPIAADTSILQWMHSHATPALDVFFLVVTTIGNVEILLPITLIIVGYLLYKKQRLNALIILFSVGGAAMANLILKLLFHRDRPSFWHSLIVETGYSFPSGHAMLSSALVLAIILITWRTRWRWVIVSLGVIFIALIGLSRIYLGVHYPTDIIAGWSVSFVWVCIVFAVASGLSYRFHRKK